MPLVRRAVAAVAAVTVLSWVGVTPAAAQSVTDSLVSGLNRRLLYLAVPIAVLVESILLYTVWRFRNYDDPMPTRKNRELEITWTVATALVLLFVGAASFSVMAHPMVSAVPPGQGTDAAGQDPADPGEVPADAVEVRVFAEQWFYTYRYPDANVTTQDALVLPTNRTVYLYVTARDVIHSVHVPELALKSDAVPGRWNLIRTRLTEPGSYRLYCAELCGAGHPEMLSTVRVVSQDEFPAWLDEQTNRTATEDRLNGSVDSRSARAASLP